MKIHRNIDQLPAFRNSVVTIGTFDGVHLGHRQILAQMKKEAIEIGGETVIISFHPHPRSILRSSQPSIQLINSIEEKIELLENLSIDHLVLVPFTEAFSRFTAKEYVEDFLIKQFKPHTVIIGYDHHFGQGRRGNYQLLEFYAGAGAFVLREIPEKIIHENTVSSTGIRKAILAGDIEEANSLLGYSFFFEGIVIEGNKLGRTLGYPTANLKVSGDDKIVPGNGVYAVEASIRAGAFAGKLFKGMMNIGTRPTIDQSRQRVIEVNLFDFEADIYGQALRVFVKKYLRPEVKFNSLDELKAQLAKDKEEATAAF